MYLSGMDRRPGAHLIADLLAEPVGDKAPLLYEQPFRDLLKNRRFVLPCEIAPGPPHPPPARSSRCAAYSDPD